MAKTATKNALKLNKPTKTAPAMIPAASAQGTKSAAVLALLASKDGPTITETRKRCAIYTRKPTEDGLDQAFNSLDAQKKAGAVVQHRGQVQEPSDSTIPWISSRGLHHP
jgi:hypothetical protein